jgi:hypothetical protein
MNDLIIFALQCLSFMAVIVIVTLAIFAVIVLTRPSNRKVSHGLIFDEVAADLGLDPRDVIRSKKEQEAADSEFFDKVEECRNDFTG